MALMTVSRCISVWKNQSMPNSKNSHRTPMVMEKQNAASATYTGESVNLIFASRFRMSISEKPTAAPKQTAITAPQDIADYIFAHGTLPDNFLTKNEARQLGWDSSKNYVSDVAPGYSIGGDKFGNYEGLLPDASGRKWYEADANYTAGPRGAERILYSSDGLVYYTNDHYQTFTEMHPSGK